VHGTIQRTVYVSNGRPLQYQDPADQIRSKARCPFKSFILSGDIISLPRESACSFDQHQQQQKKQAIENNQQKQQSEEKAKPNSPSYLLLSKLTAISDSTQELCALNDLTHKLAYEINQFHKERGSGLVVDIVKAKDKNREKEQPTPLTIDVDLGAADKENTVTVSSH
jgi:hypothetical protein